MIYDLSPPISPALAVWPGDTPPSREVLMDLCRGDSVTLSTLHATVHLGSHADAPSHYGRDAESIASRSLSRYLGRCEVIRLEVHPRSIITLDHLPKAVRAERVLLRTGTYADFGRFDVNFAALSPELIESLADAGVLLVGVDTPSVDPADSKDLPAHHACLRRDVAILEGLDLTGVPDGIYELIALPLRLVDFEASPVRAILRTSDDETIPR